MHSRVYSRMPEQFLHLLDRHSLVDGVRGQRASEFMRMNPIDAGFLSELPKTAFDAADADAVTVTIQSDK